MAAEIDDLTSLEAEVLAEIASIGFDADRSRRLEQARPAADQLRFERRQLAGAQGRIDVAGEALRLAEFEAEQAAQAAVLAENGSEDARGRWDAVAAALRAGESAHAAVHLRANLRPGQDCPVCRRLIDVLPADGSVPELDRLGRDEEEARQASAAADRLAARVAADAAAAAATAGAARQRLQSAREEVSRCHQVLSGQEHRILESVRDLLPDDPSTLVEDRVLEAARQARDRQDRDRLACDRLSGLRNQLTLARQSLDRLSPYRPPTIPHRHSPTIRSQSHRLLPPLTPRSQSG